MFWEKKEAESYALQVRETLEKKPEEHIRKTSEYSLAASLASCILLTTLTSFYITVLGSIGTFLTVMLAGTLYPVYLYGKKTRETDKTVPDLLLQASLFPPKTPATKIIDYLSKAGYPLSREFERALEETKKGADITEALENISSRIKTKSVERMTKLLVQGYECGADMTRVFKEAAADLLKTQSVMRERTITLAIERYTLLLAGALLIPLILGLLGGLTTGTNLTGLQELGLGPGQAEKEGFMKAALLGNQFYIAEYAVIVSAFIALIDNDYRKAFLYALFLVPCALLVYNLVS